MKHNDISYEPPIFYPAYSPGVVKWRSHYKVVIGLHSSPSTPPCPRYPSSGVSSQVLIITCWSLLADRLLRYGSCWSGERDADHGLIGSSLIITHNTTHCISCIFYTARSLNSSLTTWQFSCSTEHLLVCIIQPGIFVIIFAKTWKIFSNIF